MSPEAFEHLVERNRELETRLEEAEETLRALRSGEVDAVVASGPDGDRVYTLRGADESYRVMVQQMAEGALTLTTDGLILFSNEQFASLVRSPLERVIGARIQDLVAPEDVAVVSALLSGKHGRKGEVRLRTDGPSLVPVYMSVQSVVLDGIECLCLIVTDLSEQKRNQETAALMEAVPAAVFIAHDAECRSMVGNRTAYSLLRTPRGANLSKTPPGNDLPPAWHAMREGRKIPVDELPMQTAARTGRTVQDYEFDVIFNDGASRCLLGNAVPLLDEAGRPRGAVGAFVDITERKRAEERLRQTQKLESIGLLAGGIAHDFNNLLVGVIGTASLAQEMLPDADPVQELLDLITRTGQQLANLTRQMLAYSGKGRFLLERLDLSALIPAMSALVQPSIPKRIALQFELQRDLPAIEADRGQMQQVLMNLLLNAAEAIDGNAGRITVKTGVQAVDKCYIQRNPEAAELCHGNYVYLEVRDTGCGIDPATKAKIFDPFFTTKFTGRGLGLAAVSGIVRGHKGLISVQSAPGKGSCFTVMFPVSKGAVVRHEDVGRTNNAPDPGGTVLIADDEEIVRGIAKETLTRHGYNVLLANNGLEAIRILETYPDEISLVVLDLSMPGMSGVEGLPALRKIRPGIKVLVSSGYSEVETMAMFEGQRVSGFIQKPYTSTSLADKVKLTFYTG